MAFAPWDRENGPMTDVDEAPEQDEWFDGDLELQREAANRLLAIALASLVVLIAAAAWLLVATQLE